MGMPCKVVISIAAPRVDLTFDSKSTPRPDNLWIPATR